MCQCQCGRIEGEVYRPSLNPETSITVNRSIIARLLVVEVLRLGLGLGLGLGLE